MTEGFGTTVDMEKGELFFLESGIMSKKRGTWASGSDYICTFDSLSFFRPRVYLRVH